MEEVVSLHNMNISSYNNTLSVMVCRDKKVEVLMQSSRDIEKTKFHFGMLIPVMAPVGETQTRHACGKYQSSSGPDNFCLGNSP